MAQTASWLADLFGSAAHVLAGSAAAALLAAPSFAQKPAQDFSGRALTQPPRTSWPTNGGNLYNQRYSTLALINKDNVARLKPAWRTHLNGSATDSKYSAQGQPIVYDGVIYLSTGANDVFALDADTGKILWTYEAHLDQGITVVCCGWESRGVAIGEGKVFAGQLDGKLVALDAKTGKVAWSVQAETNADGFSITTAPLYYDGLLITGFAGGDRAVREPWRVGLALLLDALSRRGAAETAPPAPTAVAPVALMPEVGPPALPAADLKSVYL